MTPPLRWSGSDQHGNPGRCSKSYFILGGARSGKSRRALAIAESLGHTRVFIATAEAWDDEMAERIVKHKAERGPGWSTIEAPLDLVTALGKLDAHNKVCVVDCLTLWLSNLMHFEPRRRGRNRSALRDDHEHAHSDDSGIERGGSGDRS